MLEKLYFMVKSSKLFNQGWKKGGYLVTCNEAVEKLGGSFSQTKTKKANQLRGMNAAIILDLQ